MDLVFQLFITLLQLLLLLLALELVDELFFEARLLLWWRNLLLLRWRALLGFGRYRSGLGLDIFILLLNRHRHSLNVL